MATASGWTDFAAQSIMNFLLRGTALGNPTTNWYLGLFTVAPTAAGGGTEGYTGSARLALAVGTTDFSTASGAGTVTVTQHSLKQLAANGSGSAITIVGWGLFDNATQGSGHCWFFGQLAGAGVSVPANQVPQFVADSISFQTVASGGTSGLTDVAAQKLANYLFNGTALGNPATWYFGLHTTAPANTTTTNTGETTYTNYVRQSQPVGTGLASASAGASPQTVTITPPLTFPQNGGTSVSMLGYGMWDGSTAAAVLWIFGPLTSTAIPANVQPQFAANSISIVTTSTP